MKKAKSTEIARKLILPIAVEYDVLETTGIHIRENAKDRREDGSAIRITC